MCQLRRLLFLLIAALLPAAAIAGDGDFDTTWGVGGRLVFAADTHNPDFLSEAHRLVLEPNGNVLMTGRLVDTQSSPYWWLGEIDSNGAPVPDFGENNGTGLITGCWLSSALCHGSQGAAMVLQADGRIVLASITQLSRTSIGARSLDFSETVGGTGLVSANWVVNDVQGQMTAVTSIAVAGSGKLIVLGQGKYRATATRNDLVVARLNPDLSLDTTFNAVADANGVVFAGGQVVAFEDLGDSYAVNTSVLADGRILAQGNASSSIFAVGVGVAIRLLADGTLDSSYGVNGKAEFPDCTFFSNAVHIDRAGRALVSCIGSNPRILRIAANGLADPGFGLDGIVAIAPPSGQCTGGITVFRSVTDSAGRILVPGLCRPGIDADGDGSIDPDELLVVRLFGDDGSVDPSFGNGGYVLGHFAGNSGGDTAYAAIIDASGKPIVNGFSISANSTQLRQAGLARLDYDLIFTNDLENVPHGRLPGQ